ncbi:MAG TPA: trehalose-phosphatase [Acidimicrobiales bacterium]|nr:trehalose-phosphatase [Acidimicrobiales bacterium]
MASDRLAPWRDHPGRAGVLTDFDGTLAPIVEDPEAARPLPGVAETLAELGRVYRLVAVISGRPVAYLRDRLASPPGVVLVGLYGLEKGVGGGIETLPAAERWRRVVAEVAAAAEAEAPPGVYVERKGLSVGLHVRQAPERAGWVDRWADEQAARTGLVAHAGKMSRELVPPVDTDKGQAVAELAAGLNAVCFLGDDVGDLPAFAALARLRAGGTTTMGVAVRSAESPPALLAAADLVVDGPEGALAFLRALLPADHFWADRP